MVVIKITAHAISRYRERVAPVDYDKAHAALSCRAVHIAAAFGAKFVRIATGQRIVLEGDTVVTVMPADNYRHQVLRKGMGRFGQTRRFEERE